MIMLKKKQSRYINLNQKIQILQLIGKNIPYHDWEMKFSAYQIRELRDFLLNHLRQLFETHLKKEFQHEEIESRWMPVQKYFHSQDCRESLDACLKEACLESDPLCFSRKLEGQITVILDEIFSIQQDKGEGVV